MKRKLGRPRIDENKKRKPVTFMLEGDLAREITRLKDKNKFAEMAFLKALNREEETKSSWENLTNLIRQHGE